MEDSQSPFAIPAAAIAVLLPLCFWLAVRYDRRRQNATVDLEIREETDLLDNPVFKNLHNFRDVGGSCASNRYGQKVRGGLLFRSSRTDFMTEEEADHFMQLGIKAVIELRSTEEYRRASGSKVLGKYYTPYIGKVCKDPNKVSSPRRRYFVNMMTREYATSVYNQVNFIVRFATPVILLVDWLFGCNLTVRVYSHLVINQQSLAEWYMNILEHAKPEVVNIMRLLLEGDNVPVLVNCAHGKDRTGIIIALILSCLGVEDEAIAQDYSLSQAGLAPVRNRLVREAIGKYGFKMEFTTAPVSAMNDLLSEISKRYGGVPGYLNAAGFSTDEQQDLKNTFLEIY